MSREYVAFISYRHNPLDMKIAKQLHARIERYVIPKELRKNGAKRLGIVFRDQEELAASSDLSRDIREALDHSRFLIVVCTPDTPESEWVNREIRYFRQNHDRARILTVLAAGEPDTAFPEALTGVFDGATGSYTRMEPLAVDVRGRSSRERMAALHRESKRLFAAMLECDYDNLILRERRRQMQKGVVSVSLALAAVLSVTAVLLWKNTQIREANTRLLEQQTELQLREAQLLTAGAEDRLAEGNYCAAIEQAVRALPNSEEPDRPYYAPAESVLLQAMHIFGAQKTEGQLYDTVLEQMTAVSDFCFCGDGSVLVTIDGYGTVTGFDTTSGECLWSAYAMGSSSASADASAHLLDCGQRPQVIVCWQEHLECRSVTTGALLWSRDIGNQTNMTDNLLFYHSGRDVLLYLECHTDQNRTAQSITIVAVSGATGQTVQTIPFVEAENLEECWFPTGVSQELSKGGAFSPEGGTFVGFYAQHLAEEDRWIAKCYAADLEQGTAWVCWQEEMAEDFSRDRVMDLSFDGQSAVLTLGSGLADASAVVVKLDIPGRFRKWETVLPAASEAGTISTVLLTDDVIVGAGDRLYCVSGARGELLQTRELPGSVSCLTDVGQDVFGICLADGTYAIGWKNAAGVQLTTDDGIGVTASIEAFAKVRVFGGGVIQYSPSGDNAGISVSGSGSDSGIAFVPKESRHTIVLRRPSRSIPGIASEEIPLEPENVNLTNAVILGPFTVDQGEYYAVVNKTSHRVGKLLRTGTSDNTLCFLPEGSGYIRCCEDGSAVLVTEQGEAVFAEAGLGGPDCYDSVYLTEVRTTLTVRLAPDRLTVWRDGANPMMAQLPEALQGSPGDTWSPWIRAGANGVVLLCNSPERALSDFGAYNVVSGKWIRLRGTQVISDPKAAAFSEASSTVALADQSGTAWLLDAGSGETTASFPLQLPAGSIADMKLLRDDRYLAVKTRDRQVLIYDAADGTLVFRDKLPESAEGRLTVIEDTGNGRLYLSDSRAHGTASGFCIDMGSWTKLANIDQFLSFDPQRQELYQRGQGQTVTVSRIPDTQALVERIEQLLALTS
ncbi:MAG: TIR domain-containing protein [Faecousia sp.]